jgi:cytochrome b561
MDKTMKALKIIGIVLLITIGCIPLIGLIIVLKNFGKTVKFFPEFKIIDIENPITTQEHIDNLKSGLGKVKGDFKVE